VRACVIRGYFTFLGFPGFFRGQVRHYRKGGVIVQRVFFPWFLSVQKCKNRTVGVGGYSPDGFFLSAGSVREKCACLSVCLSLRVCVCVCVRACVCVTRGIFFTFSPGFFPWTSATKALWVMGSGAIFLMVFPRGFRPKKSAITAL